MHLYCIAHGPEAFNANKHIIIIIIIIIILLSQQVNLCDAEISLDQLRSEGLRQWNMDMDIEYQYEIFNGLPVYYGGDMYDSEDTEEFIPNAPDTLERMMCTQRLSDGGDNRSLNAVNMTPMCRTVSKG